MKSTITFLRSVQEHWLMIALLLLASALLSSCLNNGWVLWDDPSYVIKNEGIRSISLESIWSHFNAEVVQGNYHPLTMLSLSVDFWLGGLNPMVFHATNLLLHLMNSFLAYLFVFRLLKDKQLALSVGIAFAIHPMHVESYAWISERKDVLYVFFFLLGLIQYLKYIKLKSKSTLVICLLLFTASLLSKGMAVVFPLILLMIDFLNYRKGFWPLIWEKLPFFIISLLFGLIAIWAQGHGNAISLVQHHPWVQILLVPIFGLWFYIEKAFLPLGLSALHPYPYMNAPESEIPLEMFWPILPLSILLFVLVKYFKKDRILWFGVVFFILALLPVLQLFSVGSAIVADRYSYLAYLGLFISIFHLVLKGVKLAKPLIRTSLSLALIIYFLAMTFLTTQRIKVWENDETLWSDAIQTYPKDYFAYLKRGTYLSKNSDTKRGLADLNRSIEIFPYDYYSFNNRGLIYMESSLFQEAEQDFLKAIKLDSSLFEAHLNLGIIELNQGNWTEAKKHLKNALRLAPSNYLCHLNYALYLEQIGNSKEAEQSFTKAISLNPNEPRLFLYRGKFYFKEQEYTKTLLDFNHAIKLNKGYAEAYYWKSRCLFAIGEKNKAKNQFELALELGFQLPDSPAKPIN